MHHRLFGARESRRNQFFSGSSSCVYRGGNTLTGSQFGSGTGTGTVRPGKQVKEDEEELPKTITYQRPGEQKVRQETNYKETKDMRDLK